MHATALHAEGAHGVIVFARNRSGHLGRGQDEQKVPAESWRTAPHPAKKNPQYSSRRAMPRSAGQRAAASQQCGMRSHDRTE